MGVLFWLLIIAGFFYFIMRYGRDGHMAHGRQRARENNVYTTKNIQLSSVDDPVCGMTVRPREGYSEMYQGQQYRFCSRKCLEQFDQEPQRYVA